jgi:hypothetical protein
LKVNKSDERYAKNLIAVGLKVHRRMTLKIDNYNMPFISVLLALETNVRLEALNVMKGMQNPLKAVCPQVHRRITLKIDVYNMSFISVLLSLETNVRLKL